MHKLERKPVSERENRIACVVERNHEPAARCEYTPQLRKGNGDVTLISEMVERGKRNGSVERRIRKRERANIGAHSVEVGITTSSSLYDLQGDINSFHLNSVAPQQSVNAVAYGFFEEISL